MKTNNTPKEIQTILAHVHTVLEKIEAAADPESAPIQNADKDKQDMWNLLHDCKASIKGLHACVSSMTQDVYGHIYDPMHLPKMKNYDHMDFACKTLGFHKEDAIRRAAYASKNKVIVG